LGNGTNFTTNTVFGSTGSKAAATAMTLMIAFVLNIGNFNVLASVARLVWRFASDKGLPFHRHFTYASFSAFWLQKRPYVDFY
jgi:hypothetical protein